MPPTPEQIAKLPAWARALIRQRDDAVARLEALTDRQTPSEVYLEHYDCTQTPAVTRREYFQVNGNRLFIEHAGVILEVCFREGRLDCKYGPPSRVIGDVLFQPTSFQAFDLRLPEVKKKD